ncbi:cilia- and flagella-associated protein 91-like [Neoarius graeffei]|uniref:cilia- and flagella-associated protein 91-like n=1 Tax=Neoarius graeffei TaxID=443677 RepID=UPI00298C53BD|nr:cilia- and flagella-associated protein 91-like [Neoarius graeffei]
MAEVPLSKAPNPHLHPRLLWVMKVHQVTVDLYLEDVILDSINQMAKAQAREESHHMAEELNITYPMEKMSETEQSLYCFLNPMLQIKVCYMYSKSLE